jgi:hypothetical protein
MMLASGLAWRPSQTESRVVCTPEGLHADPDGGDGLAPGQRTRLL